jgi:hypothetical protein
MQQRIQPILARYQKKIERAIRNGDATDDILRALFEELRAALGPEIATITTGRMLQLMDEVGIGADVAVISQEALEHARRYTYDLVTGLDDTTRRLVREAMTTWQGTPGMTRGDLVSLLEPAFGEYRANMIAVTEVTRAYSAATNQYQRLAIDAGVDMRRVWLTTRDQLVCPICGPLHGLPEEDWRIAHPDGPPAHPNCRCSTELTVETVEEARARGEQAQEERRRTLEELGLV